MLFQRPTIKEIIERVKADFNLRLTGTSESLRFTLASVFSYVIAGVSHIMHAHLEFISKMALPDTSTGEYLARHGAIWGITRKPSSYSYGLIKFIGTDGFGIPAGTLIKGGNEIEYKTETSGFISSGEFIVNITATSPGKNGNLANTEKLNLVSPVSGIAAEQTIEADGISEGTDTENDTLYKLRILDRVRKPVSGGTVSDYKKWTLEVPGVSRAWIFPLNTGLGTVGVTFVQDDNIDIIPAAPKVAEVQAYLDSVRPITAEVNVFPPSSVAVNFNITIVPDNIETRTAIENELKDLIQREAAPGKTLLLTHIREAISVAAGEEDHNLISPTANITFTSTQIPIYGAVTWP